MNASWRDAEAARPERDLSTRMRVLARAQHQFSVRMARLLGLGPTDMWALEHLFAAGPLGPAELGQRLGMTSPSATALVDRLEAAGHVQRHPHPSDRRRLVVTPTQQAGDAAFEALSPFLHDLDAAAQELTPSERDVVMRYLDRVIDATLLFGEPTDAPTDASTRS